VLLAAVCAVLAHRAGHRECRLPISAGNRPTPDLANYVCTQAQTVMISVEVAGATFDELVRRTHGAMLRASRLGAYDVDQLTEIAGRIGRQRGVPLEFESVFNCLVHPLRTVRPRSTATAASLELARESTQLTWSSATATTPIAFELLTIDQVVRLRAVTADTARIDRTDLEQLLRAVERLLLATAGRDLPAAEICPAAGIVPLERGPGWHFIDFCWVELAEVRHLVNSALAPAPTHVEVVEDPVHGHQIVAYLAASPGLAHPEQAHDRCLAQLRGRVTAMTPHRYVVCEAGGRKPIDEDTWRTLPVLAEGPGR
jgi:hypothetical protein